MGLPNSRGFCGFGGFGGLYDIMPPCFPNLLDDQAASWKSYNYEKISPILF